MACLHAGHGELRAGPARDLPSSRHQLAGGTQTAKPNDQYAARHNLFVYFHSIIDLPTCQANVVDLSRLGADLGSRRRPRLLVHPPDLQRRPRHALHRRRPGRHGAANVLKNLVPEITSSPGFQDRGPHRPFDEAGRTRALLWRAARSQHLSPAAHARPGGGRSAPCSFPTASSGHRVQGPVQPLQPVAPRSRTTSACRTWVRGPGRTEAFDAALLNEPSCPKGAVALCKNRKRHKKHRRTAEVSKHKKHKHKKCKKRKKRHKQKPK